MKLHRPSEGLAGLFGVLFLFAAAGHAQTPSAQPATPSLSSLQTIQVTATRFGERVAEVPGSIRVVDGNEIRARGATDLRTALALIGGISVAPGGDAGPAGAVPSLLGVREIDDLLLLIDGVPAGGAFIPETTAISLNNVERIEVIKGATPVFYGTTAFAGTINVIHYAAGRADSSVTLRYGSYGSFGASGAMVLSDGPLRQSISAELNDDKRADPRASSKRAQGSWRLATELGGGQARADLNLLALRQKPDSPVPLDEATGRLTTLLPLDFNQNPTNAKIDTDRAQIVLGYELPLAIGRWGSTLAYTASQTDSIRGFIDSGDTPQPWSAATRADLEAFDQSLRLRDLFVDSHLTGSPLAGLDLTAGVNLLLGRADAGSQRYGLKLLLDGVSQTPATDSVAPKGSVDFDDNRRFIGVYVQSRYALSSEASLLGGLRWNSTHESRSQSRVNSRGVVTSSDAEQSIDRFSGSIGGRWRVYQATGGDVDALTLHASAGNTFQPAQIDFNPNPEAQSEGGGLLKPETQRSLIVGIKADAADGKAEFDVEGFWVDFRNQPVLADANGVAVLRPVGHQRFKGIDFEAVVRPASNWTVQSGASWSDARYRDFRTEVDGVDLQLAGNRQVLTPNWRGTAGLLYAAERGWRGSLTANYTGRHWLNSQNTARAPGYAVVDASIGYRFEHVGLQLAAANLGDRRDAVQTSELGEAQFYRLPARRFDLVLTLPLP